MEHFDETRIEALSVREKALLDANQVLADEERDLAAKLEVLVVQVHTCLERKTKNEERSELVAERETIRAGNET